MRLTWRPCWKAWSASWPPPPSPPRSCPPWGPAARTPPAPSPDWCDLWPAGTPLCLSPSRWSTDPQSWETWATGNPADPLWPADPLRYRSPSAWQIDSLGEHMKVMRKGDKYCIDRMNPEWTIFLLLDNEELTPGRHSLLASWILMGVLLLHIFHNELSRHVHEITLLFK